MYLIFNKTQPENKQRLRDLYSIAHKIVKSRIKVDALDSTYRSILPETQPIVGNFINVILRNAAVLNKIKPNIFRHPYDCGISEQAIKDAHKYQPVNVLAKTKKNLESTPLYIVY